MNDRFLKMEAAGNDFLLFDDRSGELGRLPADRWIDLCSRRTGAGADGVLLLQEASDADFRMRYLNADGGEAGMCGNGARCLAWAAALEFGLAHGLEPDTPRPHGWEPPPGIGLRQVWSIGFTADDGPHRALGWDRQVLVTLRDPAPPVSCRLSTAHGAFSGHQVDTGVPHLVVRVEDPGKVAVHQAGPALRAHPDLGREGANVDWVAASPDPDGAWRIRTWERGVEAETLACGTGAGAAAVVLAAAGVPSPVLLRPRGGGLLQVHYRPAGDRIADLWLEGPVRPVYRGELIP